MQPVAESLQGNCLSLGPRSSPNTFLYLLTPTPSCPSPARLSFKIKGKIKNFPDNEKLKEFITAEPVLQEMLKNL